MIYSYNEGMDGTTIAAGSDRNPRMRSLIINGVGMTSLVTETKLMAHLPLALANDPRRILIICFGMGTTARSASRYKNLTVDAVDIVPHVFESFKYFHQDAGEIMSMPNVHFHQDDGRSFLLVNKKPYDVITIDPAPPIHSAGTVNLYTKEFFQLCKSNISNEGVVSLWLPPAPFSELVMIIKGFSEVFPGSSLWGALEYPGLFLLGGHRSYDQTPESMANVARQLSSNEDLSEWDSTYRDISRVKDMFLLNSQDINTVFGIFPAVTDDNPYTEFPLLRSAFTQADNLILDSHVLLRAINKGTIRRSSFD